MNSTEKKVDLELESNEGSNAGKMHVLRVIRRQKTTFYDKDKPSVPLINKQEPTAADFALNN